MFAEMLRREGVTVEGEQPQEQRGLAEMGQAVIVAMVVKGTELAPHTRSLV